MKDKELEKLEKYQLLKDRIAKVWRMRKVTVVPVVTGALGAVSVNFKVTRPSFFGGGAFGSQPSVFIARVLNKNAV